MFGYRKINISDHTSTHTMHCYNIITFKYKHLFKFIEICNFTDLICNACSLRRCQVAFPRIY